MNEQSPRQKNPESLLDKRISRRRLIFPGKKPLLGTVGLMLASNIVPKITEFGGNLAEAAAGQIDAENRANVPLEQFLQENSPNLRKIELGTSFDPEHFRWLTWSSGVSGEPDIVDQSLQAIKIMVEDLGIKEVRLGIKWEKTTDKDGNFDFSYYQNYLDYLLQNGVNVCLNTGPIKTFRWPEQHVPEYILNKINVPPEYSFISPEMELAQAGYEYLDTLLSYLKSEYPDYLLRQITSIQPENEPYNLYGEKKWLLDIPYVKSVIKKVNEYFPDTPILINSAGFQNLELVSQTFNELTKENPQIPWQFISGYNYYYLLPTHPKIPFLGKFDSVSLAKIFQGNICRKNIQWARKTGCRIEITEAQAEPFKHHRSPGNSLSEFQFMLIRTMENILDLEGNGKSIIRIWGVERLVRDLMSETATNQQMKISELVKRINRANHPRPLLF